MGLRVCNVSEEALKAQRNKHENGNIESIVSDFRLRIMKRFGRN